MSILLIGNLHGFPVISMDKTKLIGSLVGIFLAGAIGTIIFFIVSQPEVPTRVEYPSPPNQPVSQNITPTPNVKTTKSKPAVAGESCSAPVQVQGVKVEYPGCQGNTCQYTQASCAWNAQADAATFNYTVTEVETGRVVTTASVPSTTLKVVFAITQKMTYKCDVTATNSCGSISLAASDQLLCQSDALIPTPTPTIAAPTPTPTLTPTPTPTPKPTIAPTSPPVLKPGGFGQSIGIVGIVGAALLGGLALLLF